MKTQSPTTRIGELSSDPKVAVQQIIATFQAGIDEAQAIGKQAVYVACFASDFCPFRTDGREIRMFSGDIWTHTSQTEAGEVAKQLDAKANTGKFPHRVIAMWAPEWAAKRSAKLKRMIKQVQANANKE